MTGLPLPRFAAFRASQVNMRVGPGLRYPITWVYKRRGLPVEVIREFGAWRQVRDPGGTEGWVNQALLVGRRTFITTGKLRVLRRQPNVRSAPVARLHPGVIGQLRFCKAGAMWCQVDVQAYRGWLPRVAFWGTFPGESVNQ